MKKFLSCCFFNQQSSQIFHEFYNVPWYELKSEEFKMLVIVMRTSKKPFEITAGKFTILSLEYFAKVCLQVFLKKLVMRNYSF